MDSFVGLGQNPNPNVLDIPIGLGMELMQNTEARNNFENLSDEQKNRLIHYVQSGLSGDDAKNKVASAINRLANGDTTFF